MSDFFRRLAEALAQGGGAQFGGKTFGGNTFGGNTYGGNQFGASAQPPVQGPVTVQAMPPALPSFEQPGGTADKYMPISGYGQRPTPMMVQAATMPPSQHVAGPAPSQAPMMGFDPTPPASMEMQGMAAPMPTGRNELERDYYAQLAQNPNGFNKGWLGRLFG